MNSKSLLPALILLSIVSTFYSYHYFHESMPMINLDIKTDQKMVLNLASEFEEQFQWKRPEQAHQVASFKQTDAQFFVELECGGYPAYLDIVKRPEHYQYWAYKWNVRRYLAGTANVSYFSFDPSNGKPVSFSITFPIEEPGPALNQSEAIDIATQFLRHPTFSHIDLSRFHRISETSKKRLGGRVDHTFEYELSDVTIGEEGKIRLAAKVCGDSVCSIYTYMEIPEAFYRRHEKMTSVNENIAAGASVIMAVLFLGFGGIGGLFVMMRQNQVRWKPVLLGALFMTVLHLGSAINMLPLEWKYFDTALDEETFISELINNSVQVMMVNFIQCVFILAAAESLVRRAFDWHLNIFSVFSSTHAGSKDVFLRTVIGYLLVPVMVAYESVLYKFTRSKLNWWVPSSLLEHPDMLSGYIPFISVLDESLHASILEECLFRAIPFSVAMMLGSKSKRRLSFVLSITFFISVMVFSGAHANYPSTPAYARLAELIIPSMLFSLVFLLFGLLPVFLLHFLYDYLLFGLPLLVSQHPDAFLQKAILVIIAFAPLAWVTAHRLFSKSGKATPSAFNRFNPEIDDKSDQPTPTETNNEDSTSTSTPEMSSTSTTSTSTTSTSKKTSLMDMVRKQKTLQKEDVSQGVCQHALTLGIIGLTMLLLLHHSSIAIENPAPPLLLSRAEAETRAVALVQESFDVNLGSQWEIHSMVSAPQNLPHSYVWQSENGNINQEALSHLFSNQFNVSDIRPKHHTYSRLISQSNHLAAPQWHIRLVQFDESIPIQDRAEEYHVFLARSSMRSSDEKMLRIVHVIPEHVPKQSLSKSEAEATARSALKRQLQQSTIAIHDTQQYDPENPDHLPMITSDQSKLPNRTDWTIVFNESRIFSDENSEARVSVDISGQECVDIVRFVHISDEWTRKDRSRKAKKEIYTNMLSLAVILVKLTIIVGAFVSWTKGGMETRVFTISFVFFSIIGLARAVNGYQLKTFSLSSAQSVFTQNVSLVVKSLLSIIFSSLTTSLVIGAIHAWHPSIDSPDSASAKSESKREKRIRKVRNASRATSTSNLRKRKNAKHESNSDDDLDDDERQLKQLEKKIAEKIKHGDYAAVDALLEKELDDMEYSDDSDDYEDSDSDDGTQNTRRSNIFDSSSSSSTSRKSEKKKSKTRKPVERSPFNLSMTYVSSLLGVGIGIGVRLLMVAANMAFPSELPPQTNVMALNGIFAALGIATDGIARAANHAQYCLAGLIAIDRITSGDKFKWWQSRLTMIVMGILFAPEFVGFTNPPDILANGFAIGIVFIVLFIKVFKFHIPLVIHACGGYEIAKLVVALMRPESFVDEHLAVIIASLSIHVFCAVWFRLLLENAKNK